MDFRGRRQQCGNAVSERNFRRGCRLGAARSAALHEKHANLGYASLTSCLKSPRRGQRPSICEELVLGNSTLKKPTWANAELYGGNHSHRAFQTHISTVFVHDIGFPRKGVASVASRMTMHQPILEGGRGVGDWRAGGRRACGWLAGWLATSWRLAASELTAGGDNRAGGRQSNAEGSNAEGPAPRPAQSERQSARTRPMPWCRGQRRARRRLSPKNACRRLQPTR